MRHNRIAVAASTVVLALAGLTACGDDKEEKSNAGKDAKVLADESMAALKAVDDFKMTAEGTDEGKKMAYDMCVRKGQDGKGTMTIDGEKVEVIVVGKDMYMKAGVGFWAKTMGSAEAAPEIAKLLDGKYVKNTDDEGDDGFAGITDFFDGSTDGVTKGEEIKMEGQSVIPLSKTDDEGVTTVYVKAKGTPYPVIVKHEGESPMTAKLTKGKDKCDPVAPPADQVVDPASLNA